MSAPDCLQVLVAFLATIHAPSAALDSALSCPFRELGVQPVPGRPFTELLLEHVPCNSHRTLCRGEHPEAETLGAHPADEAFHMLDIQSLAQPLTSMNGRCNMSPCFSA